MSAPKGWARIGTLAALLALVPAGAQAEQPVAESAAQPAASSRADDSAGVDTAPVREEPLEPGVDPTARPLRVFAEIERAWGRGDPESLLVHFGGGKISLSFTRTGPRGGLYTRTQAGYLLADMFKYSTTEQFKFVKFRNIEREGQLPFAVAERIYRLDSGVLYHDQVYVALRREGEAWKVAEIKSIEH